MNVKIRPERIGDRAAIRRVNRSAFAGEAEANLVDALRDGGFVEISLVAEATDQADGESHEPDALATDIAKNHEPDALATDMTDFTDVTPITDDTSTPDRRPAKSETTPWSSCWVIPTTTPASDSRRTWLSGFSHLSAGARPGWPWNWYPTRWRA